MRIIYRIAERIAKIHHKITQTYTHNETRERGNEIKS